MPCGALNPRAHEGLPARHQPVDRSLLAEARAARFGGLTGSAVTAVKAGPPAHSPRQVSSVLLSNPAFSRDAVQPREAIQVLCANIGATDHQFWPDELPLAGAVTFAGVRLMGHQQVTDAYLLGLAISCGGVLSTLDKRIAALTGPNSAELKALEIVE